MKELCSGATTVADLITHLEALQQDASPALVALGELGLRAVANDTSEQTQSLHVPPLLQVSADNHAQLRTLLTYAHSESAVDKAS